MTRVLAIMGSGETAPTHAKTHRELIDRVGGGPAVLLDTPYGFQENADDITAKAVAYFAKSVMRPIGVASWRSAEVDPVTRETALVRVREAAYVFAGPGSPSYALRQWAGTPMPHLLADKPTHGGVVTFASAAALTLGVVTVPVYEIYKVGADPFWFDGLDVLGAATGLRAAVIPHFDNAEGGTHDTRFCYLGERRLRRMEALLPEGAFVLGVDEHTACVLDLDAGTATVTGLGGVTVRAGGEVHLVVPTGSTVGIEDLRAAAEGGAVASVPPPSAIAGGTGGHGPRHGHGRSPLLTETERLEGEFTRALAARDVPSAVGALLALEDELRVWANETFAWGEDERARAVLRSMVVRLGELATAGARDPREVVGPFVETILEERRRRREAKDWAAADALRDRLVALGVEVRDTPAGVEWDLRSG